MRQTASRKVRFRSAFALMLTWRDGLLVLFLDALKTAGELDTHFAATKELKGPLHGVPISFKDLSEFAYKLGSMGIVLTLFVVDIKGYDSSMGFSPWANKPAVADADVRLP